MPNFFVQYKKLHRSLVISGKSQSTFTNYSRCLAHMAMYFQSDLLELDDDSILDYLHYLKKKRKTPSDSFFKHTVYGLRYLYRICEKESSKVILPSIPRLKKYPVVLSCQEVKALLHAPKLLRHRLIIGLLYGCGLRNHELCKLKISDFNLDRQMLHIREGKGRKDRYVPLCDMLVRGIRKYLDAEHPVDHLFHGKSRTSEYVAMSPRGVQWAIREAKRNSGIKKQVTAHCLRHTYATHLLEMGTDIVTLNELLGHANIDTTMEYLHVTRIGNHQLSVRL